MIEFSKKVIAMLSVVWFLGAILGIVTVAIQLYRGSESTDIFQVLVYISTPMTGGIVSYMLKSAYENKEKIKGHGEKMPKNEEVSE